MSKRRRERRARPFRLVLSGDERRVTERRRRERRDGIDRRIQLRRDFGERPDGEDRRKGERREA